MRKVFSLDTQLYKVTGVEKVMLDIHHALQEDYDAKIVGDIPYTRVNKDHHISEKEYMKFRNPFMFHKSIVIVHERKLLFPLWILNYFFFQNIKIVYIHHSILTGHKLFTILPKNIVAISDSGIQNLVDYFHADKKCIIKIHNCVDDIHPGAHKLCDKRGIKILYPARINSFKRQNEIVSHLQGRIDDRIQILFAGDGPLLEELQKCTRNNKQFLSLGYRDDVIDLMKECDYMMLFSSQEGLPISLIEATMCGLPIICNSVGGNSEIAFNGDNAFVSPLPDDYDWLVKTLNGLLDITDTQYIKMSQASRRVYEENFLFINFKENYLKLLSNLK